MLDLGISEVRFWDLSPRAYRALLDRKRDWTRAAEDAFNLRAGTIAAAVLNAGGGKKGGGVFRPVDFFRFGQQTTTRPTPSNAPKSPEEQAAVEAGWLAWAESTRAVAKARGMVVA